MERESVSALNLWPWSYLDFSTMASRVVTLLDYRSIQENRLRQRVAPARPRRIGDCQIPEEPFAHATLRMKLTGTLCFLDGGSENMIRVPELPDPAIIKTI